MQTVEIVNFDTWLPYEGFAAGSGRSEKIWLQSEDGKIGLFKYPKIDPDTGSITSEHVSEHIAYQLGTLLKVKTAQIDLGSYHGRQGCMSYLLNKQNEAIIEGAMFISGRHPDYDVNEMRETNSGKYYCLDHIMEVSESENIRGKWIQMMLFDYLIGNTDRHQNNWAILIRYAGEKENRFYGKACPLYDNGSSLCCYVNNMMIESYLGKDKKRFESLVDSKSRSMIRLDGYDKKRPTHREVVTYLLEKYPQARNIAREFCENLISLQISTLMESYVEVLSPSKIELIKRFLCRKIELLSEVLNGVINNET